MLQRDANTQYRWSISNVTIIATIFGNWGIIPNNWIEPIIIFTTEWLFNPDRILRKIVFIIFGISGLSIIGFGLTIFLKNVFAD